MVNKNNNTQEKKKVLVGDDQIGVVGSIENKAFLRNYSNIADFDFASEECDFIQRAKNGRYDSLLIDLNWSEEDNSREDKTGFRVLESVKSYSPIRILHTSDEKYIKYGLKYGATDFAEKHRSKDYLAQKLNGGVKI
ncbi:MAG: hypothetical protein WCK29_04445 [archaeon]